MKDRSGRARGVLISTGILLSLAGTTAVGAWGGGQALYSGIRQQIADQRDEFTKQVAELRAAQVAADRERADLQRRTAVIEAGQSYTVQRLDSIDHKLDRFDDKLDAAIAKGAK